MPGAARAAGPPAPAGGRGARARGVVLRMQAREEKHASAEGSAGRDAAGLCPPRSGVVLARRPVRPWRCRPSSRPPIVLDGLPRAARTSLYTEVEMSSYATLMHAVLRAGVPLEVLRSARRGGSLWIFDSQLNFVFVSASGFALGQTDIQFRGKKHTHPNSTLQIYMDNIFVFH